MGESDGQVNIHIGVMKGSLQTPVIIEFSTKPVSAAGKLHKISYVKYIYENFPRIDGSDYSGLAELYTLDSTSTINVSVTITKDVIFELTELFSAHISFPGAQIPRVTLVPNSTDVTILDDDGHNCYYYCEFVYHMHCACYLL